MELDVIIIGRGGGSTEDLDPFNNEELAYTIFNAKTPIISAVGHEINDSISDLVADVRVATPTAAGNLATFDYYEFESELEEYRLTLDNIIDNKLSLIKERLVSKKDNLIYLSPKSRLDRYKEMNEEKKERLKAIIKHKVVIKKSDLIYYIEKLKSRNVLDKMKNGLGFVSDSKGRKIKTIKQVKKDDELNVRISDGVIRSRVLKVERG